MARLLYQPNPIIPTDPQALQTYLQRELETIARVVANFNVTDALNDEVENGGPGVISDHESLTGRGNLDQHPIIAITGLQDALDNAGNQVFFQPTMPSDADSKAGDIWFASGYD
jgi:hypothetical protein